MTTVAGVKAKSRVTCSLIQLKLVDHDRYLKTNIEEIYNLLMNLLTPLRRFAYSILQLSHLHKGEIN